VRQYHEMVASDPSSGTFFLSAGSECLLSPAPAPESGDSEATRSDPRRSSSNSGLAPAFLYSLYWMVGRHILYLAETTSRIAPEKESSRTEGNAAQRWRLGPLSVSTPADMKTSRATMNHHQNSSAAIWASACFILVHYADAQTRAICDFFSEN